MKVKSTQASTTRLPIDFRFRFLKFNEENYNMSIIAINDLTEIKILGESTMTRVLGGTSYPVEEDGGIGGPAMSPFLGIKLPFDLGDSLLDFEKMREEVLPLIGNMPSIPEPFPGADPLGGPF
jgi:hypothetical protein